MPVATSFLSWRTILCRAQVRIQPDGWSSYQRLVGQRSPQLVRLWWGAMAGGCGTTDVVFRSMQAASGGTNRSGRAIQAAKESTSWAELARAEAANQNWRGSALPLLGGNRHAQGAAGCGGKIAHSSRYVLLLEPGAGRAAGRFRLPQLFKRSVWYGTGPWENIATARSRCSAIQAQWLARPAHCALVLGGDDRAAHHVRHFSPANDDSIQFGSRRQQRFSEARQAYLVLGELGYGARRWRLL